MSDEKGSGDGERTVFRPNPGRRLPAAPSAPAPPPQQQGAGDDWIAARFREEAPHRDNDLPRAEDLHFDELAAPSANPIMRAAGPLLLLLGRLRVAALRASFASLMEQVVEAVKFFEKDIRAAGVPEGRADAAKYLICATADDIVQNIPTEDRHVWAQYSMLSRFFGERIGGVRFFDELERLLVDPAQNYDVLELQHACMALGFQGVYRASGVAGLQTRQRTLYETLRRVKPRPFGPLSPHWEGQNLGLRRSRFRAPAWAIAGVIALCAFLGFLLLRSRVTDRAEAVAGEIHALHPDTKIALQRRIPTAPPKIQPSAQQATQLDRIRAGLASDNGACAITADAEGGWVVIRVCNLILFNSGDAKVLPQFAPEAKRIGAVIEKEAGPVRIVGHTDNVALSPANRFQSNFNLSVERAKAVAAVLKPMLSDPGRIAVEGKGPDQPIASNATADGRARNRRVEILVTKVD
ncbi:MAG TPA: type IVB secretion system protein IcmH/DotU [Rhodoblastus sp.]|nr:type IVB secretion system protein IcmH/DotU [Rhodoblastus sp.]